MDGISALYDLTGGFERNPTSSDLFFANLGSSLSDGSAFDGLGNFIGGYSGNKEADEFMKFQRKALEDLMKIYMGFAQGTLDTQNQYSKENAFADAAKLAEGYKTSALAAFQNAIPKFATLQAASGSYSNTGVQNLMNEFAASAAAKLAAEQSKLTADMITNYRKLQNDAFAAAKVPQFSGNPAAATKNESAEGDLLGGLIDFGAKTLLSSAVKSFLPLPF